MSRLAIVAICRLRTTILVASANGATLHRQIGGGVVQDAGRAHRRIGGACHCQDSAIKSQ